MLSREDNETLVRVGPQTPMGQFMRLYWIPFLKSSDVAPDCQPYRVRLLGEELVAFRDSSGRVGLVAQACPHRGAPLVFGRNEADGLRCIYHGWKFGVDGRCLDIPVEPAGSPMCKRMRVTAYAVRERNGMLWAYMGPDQENPPELPAVEWNLVPETQVAISMRVQECNWLQALEGEIDSAHAAILHGRVDVGGTINQWKQGADLTPTFECVQHDAGVSIAARRKTPDGQNYVRVNQFMLPFWTLVPPQAQFPDLSGHAWVPIDDEHTLCVMFSYTPAQPFYEKTRQVFKNGHAGRETGHHSEGAYEKRSVTEPYHTYWSRFNRGNAYHFDYAQQVSKYNAGMPGLWIQDAACQSGVQPIYDRSQEHLGTSDSGIARTRRVLLEGVRQLKAGTPPVSAAEPGLFMKRAVSITIPAGGDWMTLGGDHMRAELGKDFGYTP